MTEEARRRLSERMKGEGNPSRRPEGSHRLGTHHTEATRQKMAAAAKRRTRSVVNLDTRTVYASMREAAAKTGLHASHICAVCKGVRETHGGYRWAYNDKED